MQFIKAIFLAFAAVSFLLVTAANATHVLLHHAARAGGRVYNRAPISRHETTLPAERKEQRESEPFGGY
jgi:hypothetical protein